MGGRDASPKKYCRGPSCTAAASTSGKPHQIECKRPAQENYVRNTQLTDALSVLDAVVTLVELEVVAAGGGDAVVEQDAVGDEVPDADALAAAVVDLHILDDNAVDRGLVRDALLVSVVTGLAVAWEGRGGGGAWTKSGEGACSYCKLF